MTTESHPLHLRGSARVLRGAVLATLALGAVAVLLGALLAGREASYAALVGTGIVVGVFGLGAALVNAVAGLLPSAALLVALLTYTLQVVLMAALFLALSRSGLLDDVLDRRWLAGTVIGGVFVWLTAHVVLAVRVRIPLYELPDHGDEVDGR